METEIVAVALLKPPKRNVRVHPEKQVAELARSVEQFGQIRPIVIDDENTVLAGNGLVEAFKKLGRSEIAAYRATGLSAAQKTKLMLSDNKVFSLGLDDFDAILDSFRELNFDFDIPGFDADVLDGLMRDSASATETALGSYGVLPEEAVSEAEATETRTGSTASPPSNFAKDAVRCPNCAHAFLPS